MFLKQEKPEMDDFERKYFCIFSGRGSTLPPLADTSAKNVIF